MAQLNTAFERRRARLRSKLKKRGGLRPRLSIHRSGKHIYAQVIDDNQGVTLAAASTLDSSLRSGSGATVDAAKAVGELVAKRAKDAGIDKVVFDRGGFLYHGRVKALADGAREGGLDF